MNDVQYVTKIPAGDNYNLTFQTQKVHQNDIYYIGVFTDVVRKVLKYRYTFYGHILQIFLCRFIFKLLVINTVFFNFHLG